MISPGVFFQFFKILIFRAVRGVKGQKSVQNDKKFWPSCFISQEPYIIWLSFLVHFCKMIISPDFFFIFSKFWFFWVVREVKGQKWSKMTKEICLLHSISQKPYIISLSFMVRMCKMILSPGVFFIFSIFRLFRLSRGEVKGQKTVQNDKKFCPSLAPYFRNHTSYDFNLWYTCVKR